MRLRIADWDKHFENAASRKLKRLDWVAIPNKTDGEGYTALVDHPNAAAHLGAWYAIVEAASKQSPRGYLPGGIPHNVGGVCQSLSRMSRLPKKVFEEVLPRLIEIGWVEDEHQCNQQKRPETVAESADVVAESADVVGRSADVVGRSADVVAAHYRELQGTELQRTTANYSERGEFPESAKAVRSRFPEVDDMFIVKLATAVCSMAAHLNGKAKIEVNDQLIAEGIRYCEKATPKQNGAGLYLTTVPQVIKTWITQGKPREPDAPVYYDLKKEREEEAARRRKVEEQGYIPIRSQH